MFARQGQQTQSSERSRSGALTSADKLEAIAFQLTYGGTLTVSNIGPDPLISGDSFELFFGGGGFAGSFSSVSLPALAPGLSWNNTLLSDGTITVVGEETALLIDGFSFEGGSNVILSVAGGSPGNSWDLLSTTNVVLPLINWSVIDSGLFSGSGSLNVTNGINPAEPSRFYRFNEIPAP